MFAFIIDYKVSSTLASRQFENFIEIYTKKNDNTLSKVNNNNKNKTIINLIFKDGSNLFIGIGGIDFGIIFYFA